jgi:hypothetical protein
MAADFSPELGSLPWNEMHSISNGWHFEKNDLMQ